MPIKGNLSCMTCSHSHYGQPFTSKQLLVTLSCTELTFFDFSTLFWTQIIVATGKGSIAKANLDGSGRQKIVREQRYPAGIAIDHSASRLYWADFSDHKIRSSDLNGQDVRAVASVARDGPWGVAVHNGKLYWGNYWGKTVQTSDLRGQNRQFVYSGVTGVEHLIVATVKASAH